MPSSYWIPATTSPEFTEDEVHVLLWQATGSAVVTVREVDYHLVQAQALWVPIGWTHRFVVHPNSATVPLFFEAADTDTRLVEPTVVDIDDAIHTLLLAHQVSWTTSVRRGSGLARQIVARLEQHARHNLSDLPLPRAESARAVAQSLKANPGDTRTIGELAQSVHVSQRSLERHFIAETGMTLRRWRLQLRMLAAATQLRGTVSPNAVALRVGYTHPASFRRAFKDHFGITPAQYSAERAAQLALKSPGVLA